MRHQDRGQEQHLAATLAAPLLVGTTLIARELVGLWPAAGLGMGCVLAVSWGPVAARRIAVAVAVVQLRQRIASHERTDR